MQNHYEIIVVGAGASGLMAALTAAQEQKKAHRPVSVALLEAAAKPGRKLLATGNGRCNLTNMNLENARFHGDVQLAEAVLGKYSPQAVIRRFMSLGLLCREEEQGRVYPNSGQAASVLSVLLSHLEELGVPILCGQKVERIQQESSRFFLKTAEGIGFAAQKVILAVSGKAAPQLGSDGSGLRLAGELGHSHTPCWEALVPVICQSGDLKAMQGMRCRGKVSLLGDGVVLGEETGEIQFTDYGLSGICVFQLSRMASEWVQQKTVLGKRTGSLVFSLDLLPDVSQEELQAMLQYRKRILPGSPATEAVSGILNLRVGERLVRQVLKDTGKTMAELSSHELEKIAYGVKNACFPVKGVQDWSRAQVTAGGIPLREVFPDTLESRCTRGLYLCGELLNVDGDCGGYNLHWAWASGMAAGKAAAGSLPKKQGQKARRKPHAANR